MASSRTRLVWIRRSSTRRHLIGAWLALHRRRRTALRWGRRRDVNFGLMRFCGHSRVKVLEWMTHCSNLDVTHSNESNQIQCSAKKSIGECHKASAFSRPQDSARKLDRASEREPPSLHGASEIFFFCVSKKTTSVPDCFRQFPFFGTQ